MTRHFLGSAAAGTRAGQESSNPEDKNEHPISEGAPVNWHRLIARDAERDTAILDSKTRP